jgi:hypothetical protein
MHFDKLMLLWMEQEEQTFVVMILENSPLSIGMQFPLREQRRLCQRYWKGTGRMVTTLCEWNGRGAVVYRGGFFQIAAGNGLCSNLYYYVVGISKLFQRGEEDFAHDDSFINSLRWTPHRQVFVIVSYRSVIGSHVETAFRAFSLPFSDWRMVENVIYYSLSTARQTQEDWVDGVGNSAFRLPLLMAGSLGGMEHQKTQDARFQRQQETPRHNGRDIDNLPVQYRT